MKVTYREVNGYLIPNLKLPPEEASIELGKFGMMRKDYLEKHIDKGNIGFQKTTNPKIQ